jgi:hypothetical protein
MNRSAASLACALLALICRPAASCTVFFASDGSTVLAGNNEDFYNSKTKVWFLPGEEGKYGRVYFGFDDYIRQGGMNDQGLFFDTVSAETLEMPQCKGKARYRGDLIAKAMEECATVEEVIVMFRELGPYADPTDVPSVRGAIMFSDKSGDSVIIEGDTQIRKQGRFQVMTNFYQSRSDLGGFPCKRYAIANEMLGRGERISVDLFRGVLAAVHMDHEVGFSNPTVYSNIYDLKRGLVYVYHFHNFENTVVLDVAEELKKGRHDHDLPSLFPETMAAFVYESARPRQLSEILRQIIEEEGISVAVERFRELRDERRELPTYFCSGDRLNRLGYDLMGAEKLIEAVEVFKLYVETFPDDWNAHDSLGEAYMNSGLTDLAIQSYEMSVKLNPANTNGKQMLRRLRGGE